MTSAHPAIPLTCRQLRLHPVGAPQPGASDGACGSSARRREGERDPAGQVVVLLTDPLTRRCGTGETQRKAGDASWARGQVSETYRHAGDEEDAHRMSHNPEVAGSNPAPATKRSSHFTSVH